MFVHADVRHEDEVRNLVDETVRRFGRLDIAVNNAATEGLRGLGTEQTAESYAATFDSNVLGVLLSMKYELRVMLPQGSGSIVNVSSTYGRVGAAGASVYVASKHAVEGLTKSAALEVAGTGVRVNVVAPGTTDTGMLTRFTNTDDNKAALVSTVPLKRLATPEEIAHVIAFVASAQASYMTGASIPVDGAMSAD
jgi:NAD(P)-dependent dehydrogenase (short-subunit alcohol dehydrogenase family)